MIGIESLVETLIDTFVKPRLEKIDDKINLETKLAYSKVCNIFKEYITREYNHLINISSIVNIGENRNLKQLYVPLTISLKTESKKNKNFSIQFSKLSSSFMKDNFKLVVDTAGMGKSTLLKVMFINVVDNNQGIPVFIELRRINKENSILDEIIKKLSTLHKNYMREFITHSLERGKFIFLLDGYDEVKIEERSFVSNQILDLTSRLSKNIFILSSRPEDSLKSFNRFYEYYIKPLKKEEAYELLKKYDSFGETSKLLIDKIENEYYETIKDFMRNPLLCSLLYSAFDYRNTIPFKKHLFYRQVYDAFFESHDLTKSGAFVRDKLSKLGTDDFHQVLRYLGYVTYVNDETEFTKDEILNRIRGFSKLHNTFDIDESNFLKDLTRSVPLFTKDGIFYKWAHKSIQEYFAAQFIYLDSRENKNEILEKLAISSVKYHQNILDIYYGIDNFGFNKNVTKKVLNELFSSLNLVKNSCKKSYNTHHKYRVQLLFGRKFYFGIGYSSKLYDKIEIKGEYLHMAVMSQDFSVKITSKPVISNLNLLQENNLPFFEEIIIDDFEGDFLTYAKDQKKRINIDKEGVFYEVGCDENIINESDEVVQIWNELIIRFYLENYPTGKGKYKIINIEKAKTFLSSIEKDISNVDKFDFGLDKI